MVPSLWRPRHRHTQLARSATHPSLIQKTVPADNLITWVGRKPRGAAPVMATNQRYQHIPANVNRGAWCVSGVKATKTDYSGSSLQK